MKFPKSGFYLITNELYQDYFTRLAGILTPVLFKNEVGSDPQVFQVNNKMEVIIFKYSDWNKLGIMVKGDAHYIFQELKRIVPARSEYVGFHFSEFAIYSWTSWNKTRSLNLSSNYFKYVSQVLRTPISLLNLPKRPYYICMNMGVHELGEIASQPESAFKSRINSGPKSVYAIKELLERFDLKFGMTEEELQNYDKLNNRLGSEEEILQDIEISYSYDLRQKLCNEFGDQADIVRAIEEGRMEIGNLILDKIKYLKILYEEWKSSL